jgi:hypothetical protein
MRGREPSAASRDLLGARGVRRDGLEDLRRVGALLGNRDHRRVESRRVEHDVGHAIGDLQATRGAAGRAFHVGAADVDDVEMTERTETLR